MQKKAGARGAQRGKKDRRAVLGVQEKRRLTQLALCAALFLTIFLGKGIAPEAMLQSGENLLRIIRSDADFAGAFTQVGAALSEGEPVLEALGRLAVEVFGGDETGAHGEAPKGGGDGPAAQAAAAALIQRPNGQTMLLQLGKALPAREPAGGPAEEEAGEPAPTPQPAAQPTPEPTPDVPAYAGPALPAGATMDYVELELAETVTPVLGELTSPYGYRDHPINGEYQFHAGADLAADMGTPVAAFANGTVDFIGESEAYGLYIQLDHGNGVTSFYCHCSALYARKGDTVSAGQTIAAVGDTGNATGPHLHLELEHDGVTLNPEYYIETQ